MNDDGNINLPQRKKLPHDIPSWVEPGAKYFISINCLVRGKPQLTNRETAGVIIKSALYYQTAGKWWIHLFLLMPDHLHGIVSFAREIPMRKVVADWKHYLSAKHGLAWQRDFFDHRLRNDDAVREKWQYIMENPVRKKLVTRVEEWPFFWTAKTIAQR